MENGAIASLIGQWNGRIPADSVYSLQEELKSISDDKQIVLASLPLKSQVVGLILGLCLGSFGADRFYKGDTKFGIYKAGLFVVYIVCLGISAGIGGTFGGVFAMIGFVALLALGILAIVDLFLVWKGIQKDNLAKIRQAMR